LQGDHADYDDVRAALEAMRSVATLVNERKRRMESLEKLSAWQQRVEGWEVNKSFFLFYCFNAERQNNKRF
jgi:hypothetical protein